METPFPPPYSIRVSKRARKPGLRIAPNVGLEVVLPERFQKTDAAALVQRHRQWIERHYERIMQPAPTSAPLEDGFFIDGGSTFISFSAQPLSQEYLHQQAQKILPSVITPRHIHQRHESFFAPYASSGSPGPSGLSGSHGSRDSCTPPAQDISGTSGASGYSNISSGPNISSSPNVSGDSSILCESFTLADFDISGHSDSLRLPRSPRIKDSPRLFESLRQWTLAEAQTVFLPQLEALVQQQGLSINRCVFKLQKTRWGSCSTKKNININANIVFLPAQLARYILIHELCHLYHLNHSNLFWKRVFEFEPQALHLDKALRHAKKYLPWHRLA